MFLLLHNHKNGNTNVRRGWRTTKKCDVLDSCGAYNNIGEGTLKVIHETCFACKRALFGEGAS